ncbi:hypothetical protein HY993_00300 [Candidatus Micrarchaeota archaeon]|nr:hypothetical protein [Candidatus Micrarchaeota archaeon]
MVLNSQKLRFDPNKVKKKLIPQFHPLSKIKAALEDAGIPHAYFSKSIIIRVGDGAALRNGFNNFFGEARARELSEKHAGDHEKIMRELITAVLEKHRLENKQFVLDSVRKQGALHSMRLFFGAKN